MMPSILELYRIGRGPSSSHTMGPARAAQLFLSRNPGTEPIRVTLFGSLAATGRGHLTDAAIHEALGSRLERILWQPDVILSRHPNALRFELIQAGGPADSWTVYSIGGGALAADDGLEEQTGELYALTTMEGILHWCHDHGQPLWRYVEAVEGQGLWEQLQLRWAAMIAAIERGVGAEGVLPGGLKLERRARTFNLKARNAGNALLARGARLGAYALAVSEENAAGGEIVTAPTCGACGVLPSVLRYCQETLDLSDGEILRGLATAGLIGNLVKTNGSISGAEVGCQGEIGTACAMASGAAAWFLGGTPRQIEYAAEMGIEHHLGLTCDPVMGLVQIPCIERNAFAAMRALDCAEYALLSDGQHRIPFDEAVNVMLETGRDMSLAYRETARGGLATVPSVHRVENPEGGFSPLPRLTGNSA